MKRFRILFGILCACIVSVAWSETAATCNGDWMEFHRPNMKRWNPCEKTLNVNNVGRLKQLWSYTTGNSVYSSPAVVNGVVYVGSEDSNVYALNATTGAKLWSYATSFGVYSSPTVANGMVYAGDGNGKVYALRAKTGALLWSYTTGTVEYSSPAVSNGVVYLGSYDHNLYAFGLK